MRPEYRMWTPEEVELAVRNVFRISNEELEILVGRNMNGIDKKLKTLTANGKIGKYTRRFTKIEDEIILENYGSIPMKMLCERIYRTEPSVRGRLRYLTGESKHNCINGMMNVSEVALILGYTVQYVRRIIRDNDTPFSKETGMMLVDMDEFFNWIQENPKFIHASRINDDDLYYCPEWYVDKVKELKLAETKATIKKGEWSTKEIALAKLLKSKGKTLREIAEELNRTWRSVKEMFARARKMEKNVDSQYK